MIGFTGLCCLRRPDGRGRAFVFFPAFESAFSQLGLNAGLVKRKRGGLTWRNCIPAAAQHGTFAGSRTMRRIDAPHPLNHLADVDAQHPLNHLADVDASSRMDMNTGLP